MPVLLANPLVCFLCVFCVFFVCFLCVFCVWRERERGLFLFVLFLCVLPPERAKRERERRERERERRDKHNTTAGTTGYVWNDVDGDGEQDAAEPPLSGVLVTLRTCSGVDVAWTTTLANGTYSFSNVAPGCYVEVFSTPANFVPTVQNASAVNPTQNSDINPAGVTANLTLVSGVILQNVDAGFSQKTSIGDFVWYDANNDGLQGSTEVGLAGVAVSLSTCAGALVATTTSGATGFYEFNDLLPGCYKVSFGIPAGFVASPANAGSDDSIDSDVNASGVVDSIVLAAGSPNRTIAAGFSGGIPASKFASHMHTHTHAYMHTYTPSLLFSSSSSRSLIPICAVAIGGNVWNDVNGDGQQNASEPSLPGVTVTLKTCSGDTVATTVSDAAGTYTINNLAPGCYYVELGTPTGFVPTRENVGPDATDSDINPLGKTANLTVNSGDSVTVGSGFVQPASIGKFVWFDINGDGVQDAGEPGLAGVVVTLLEGGIPIATTVSSSNGFYSFTDLIPGSYSVQFTVPTGFTVTVQNAGAATLSTDSDINATGATAAITLAQGENRLDIAAGFTGGATSTLGQFVWNDLNGNGVQDSGEPGLGGVQVTLVTSTGVVVATQTTTETGHFLFENVVPGSYYIEFATPSGLIPTTKQAGSNTTVDSDINSTSTTDLIVVASGTNNTSIGAGFVAPEGHQFKIYTRTYTFYLIRIIRIKFFKTN